MIANQRFPGRVRPDDKMLAPTLYAYDADEELCRLFERVFGKSMGKTESLRHFKWEYHFNPAGKAIVYVIRNEEGQIVSAYPTMPLKVKFMSGIVRASLSFDSMTLPEYKGRGLFTTLGRALYQYLGKSGYVLTYGFPNGNIQNLRVTNFSGSPSALAEGAEYFKVDIPANKEALGNSGVWVKYEDVDDLSKKLLYILNNYAEMEMQKNINYQRVVEYFTWDNVSNLYIKYIKTLANA